MSDDAPAPAGPAVPVEPAVPPRPPADRDLGPVGIWSGQFDFSSADVVRAAVGELESLGYPTVWTGEAIGREVLTAVGLMLAATSSLTVATGIAQIHARNALTMAAGHLALSEAYPDRFVLGMGISHKLLMDVRGIAYRTPLTQMRAYLDEMDRTSGIYRAVAPPSAVRVLAALGPRMLDLARERADGAHTYFVPPEHTVDARTALGPGKILAPEQAFVLDTNPSSARALARRHTTSYLRLPNYTNNLRRYGFTDEDFADGGSDRLVDTIVVWGDADALLARIKEHRDAGADHVCVQVLDENRRGLPRRQWRELAPALLGR